jgi:hypothetical protein
MIRSGARVVHPHALLRVDERYHHSHDGTGRVELAALLLGRVGELLD